MTDIFIKSFNRPFYLERCIYSIYKHVSGSFRIKVLDDGTPRKYLNKIQEKYPEIEILLSENHDRKTKAIEENLRLGTAINGFEIPTRFWFENVKTASKYVIVTEDDVWCTNAIDVDELQRQAQQFNINLIKLGWLGNKKDIEKLILKPISAEVESATPKDLLLFPRRLMRSFFYNQYKFFTILYKLRKVDNSTIRRYWALNSILMGFFNKDYWLSIWTGMDGQVDEKKQLLNASVYYKKNKDNPNFISKLKQESMKTTFQSSATNSYHEYGFAFDVNLFNHIINEAWLNGDFDAKENLPKDFSMDYYEKFVSNKIDISEFRKWVVQFRKQYENIGCKTE